MPDKKDFEFIRHLLNLNDIDAELIGSVKEKGKSEHDLDIVLDLTPLLKRLFHPKKVTKTDWNGYYLEGTTWGDLDIFVASPTDCLKIRDWEIEDISR